MFQLAVALLAVALPAALSAPSGWGASSAWGPVLGGTILAAGPTTVSRTSLVQTHPSPAIVVAHAPIVAAAPIAVAPVLQKTVLTGPIGLSGLGLGLGHGVHGW